MNNKKPAIWFPTVKTGTGTDIFTLRLVDGLTQRGYKAEITWLPLRSEYAPWSVKKPQPPAWANIVHINSWLNPKFVSDKLPLIVSLHHSAHDPLLRPYKNLARHLYHKYWIGPKEIVLFKQASKVIACSKHSAKVAQKNLINLPIDVILNGISTNKIATTKKQNASHPFKLLYVGNWKKLKGVELLNPIMQKLGDNFVLYYTGGKAAEADKKNMPNNMIDIGRVSNQEILEYMRNSDAFLFPSRSEGLPLVGIEAMACGLPIIGTNATSIPEIVDDGVTGILCEKDNIQEFVYAAKRLAAEPELHANMRIASRKKAESQLNFDTMLDQYIEAYEAVLNNHAN